jgi:hypothetical protein
MTNPEPVAPPSLESASIETTDGSTRWAISATDPAGRSIVDEDLTNFTEWPKSDPVDAALKVPAIKPTTSAKTIADRRGMDFPELRELGGVHHGPLL